MKKTHNEKEETGICPSTFGLDLGDLSLKVVEIVERRGLHRISGFGYRAIPPGCVVDGEIHNEEVVAQAIRSVCASARPRSIRCKNVVCSLPETKAFLRIIEIPSMSENEAKEAVRWEMEANIPMPSDEVYFDWQTVPSDFGAPEGKMRVLVVAVSRRVVDQFVSVLERAGLVPIALEIESIAQVRSLLSDDGNVAQGKVRTKMIMDIGDRRTGFIVVHDGVPSFTSSIPLCAQSLTDAISKTLGISIEEAEKMKIKSGIGSSHDGDPISPAVRPVLENFVTEIDRSIDFFVSGLKYADDVEEIFLCGGGASTKGIVPFLSRRISRPFIIGDPWKNLSFGGSVPPIAQDQSVRYATAIGLALRGVL